MRNVVILGSTGSVGATTLEVIEEFPDHFRASGLLAHSSVEKLAEQALRFRPDRVVVVEESARRRLTTLLAGEGIEVVPMAEAGPAMIAAPETDVVLNAIVGVAGLAPAVATLEAGKTLAVANKEPLVAAGPLLQSIAARTGATILPVDSEHSAIFQALKAGRREEVRTILLTASGGPFRERDPDSFPGIRPEQALRHPTWTMGPKISIDSATMMNKALEVIEAVNLFGIGADRIRVLVHPQSIVHSMVEFCDGSVVAQMGRPDMSLPVLYALSWPTRLPSERVTFSIEDYRQLTFEDPDPARYPALELGFRAAREGGLSGAVLNAANEHAVEAFLAGRISFPDITRISGRVYEEHDRMSAPQLGDVIEADRRARLEVERCLTS